VEVRNLIGPALAPPHLLKGQTSPVTALAFSPDAARVATGSVEGTVKIWDARGGGVAYPLYGLRIRNREPDANLDWNAQSDVAKVSLGANRILAAAVAEDTTALPTLAANTLGLTGSPLGPGPLAAAVGLGPGTTGASKPVLVFEGVTGAALHLLKGQPGPINAVALSADRARLAVATTPPRPKNDPASSGEEMTEIVVWDMATGKKLRTFAALKGRLDFSVATADHGGSVDLVAVTTDDDPDPGGWDVYPLALSPDGKKLYARLVGTKGVETKLWDVASGRQLGTWAKAFLEVSSPDGKFLATYSVDLGPPGARSKPVLKLWDVAAAPKRLLVEKGLRLPHQTVPTFSPDGKLFAPGTGEVWVLEGGRLARTLRAPAGQISFFPDGKRLVANGKVWDIALGRQLLTLPWGGQDVAIHPDGRRLLLGQMMLDARPRTASVREELEAYGLVTFLFDRPLTRSEAVAHLRASKQITEGVRRRALALAERFHDDPNRFLFAAQAVVRRTGATPGQYRQALHWAEEAVRMRPLDSEAQELLVVAQYRAKQYKAALVTLDRLLAGSEGPGYLSMMAFRAMAEYRLGKTGQALATWKQVEQARLRRGNSVHSEILGILREAETLILGTKPRPKK
jgi:WD40 repeat protein